MWDVTPCSVGSAAHLWVDTYIRCEGRRWSRCKVYYASGLAETLVSAKVNGVA